MLGYPVTPWDPGGSPPDSPGPPPHPQNSSWDGDQGGGGLGKWASVPPPTSTPLQSFCFLPAQRFPCWHQLGVQIRRDIQFVEAKWVQHAFIWVELPRCRGWLWLTKTGGNLPKDVSLLCLPKKW